MARLPTTFSIKTLIVVFALAAIPAVSFAQATGSTGSTGGVANSPAPAPGTNSLGTAQSSGANAPGVTTGTGAGGSTDAAVNAENRLLDKKLKSICRGC
ncbi:MULTISPECIES: hypothetical protein [unclassified Bradyrhizobium]|jgi:hypothetical protein|uniref:hypothetical protein n=1 Tax=unclassified Bradyrhizobium TaxID=2631580 RepID=UPI001FF7F543|nr:MULTISPECIES: hypothetical protein [unclassified Bradyrhizobium]MCK1524677.1 hypothetical protein [Bradyrhizobium sp. 17]MCK1687492.1 hypothetical protein [Bradyrhizobium sp. 145]